MNGGCPLPGNVLVVRWLMHTAYIHTSYLNLIYEVEIYANLIDEPVCKGKSQIFLKIHCRIKFYKSNAIS